MKKIVHCSENMERAHFVSVDVVCVQGWGRLLGVALVKRPLPFEARKPRLQHHMGLDACEKPFVCVCGEQRRRPTCASAQSDQRLYYSLSENKVT